MRSLILMCALGAAACERESAESAAVPAPSAPEAMLPPSLSVPQSAAVVDRPKEQAQLDRMILAGYTPHADHLHPPGVNKCPMSKDSDVVM